MGSALRRVEAFETARNLAGCPGRFPHLMVETPSELGGQRLRGSHSTSRFCSPSRGSNSGSPVRSIALNFESAARQGFGTIRAE
jgi:hypothetical protein